MQFVVFQTHCFPNKSAWLDQASCYSCLQIARKQNKKLLAEEPKSRPFYSEDDSCRQRKAKSETKQHWRWQQPVLGTVLS